MNKLFSVLGRWIFAVSLMVALLAGSAWGMAERDNIFPIPQGGTDVVGRLKVIQVAGEETLVDVSRTYKHGFDAVKAANPGVDAWMPGEGTRVRLPGKHVLPDAPRNGIVINVSEKRLYYYPDASSGQSPTVEVYAVSVGRGDWSTPLKTTQVLGMVKNPAWFPPQSVRDEHAARGDILPKRVPAGPDNPLGDYVIRLAIPSYFIHGTNRENGIGMQVTHGCIRMYPVDIEGLALRVPKKTPVHIVNQRYKAGWKDGVLYMEVHPPLEGVGEDEDKSSRTLTSTLAAIKDSAPGTYIDWAEVWRVQEAQQGLPMPVGEWGEP